MPLNARLQQDVSEEDARNIMLNHSTVSRPALIKVQ
jgi:hypothetical protein